MSRQITHMVFLMAILAIPLVYADGAAPQGKDCPEGWIFRQLDLSVPQEKQFKDILQKQKASMKATFEQMKANRKAFNNEILATTPDINKLNELQAQLKAAQSQMVDSRLSTLLEAKKILTAEQFAQFLETQKKSERGFHNQQRGHDREDEENEHHGDND